MIHDTPDTISDPGQTISKTVKNSTYPSENNDGHRNRLLERFEKSGADAFHPYELLELLLTFAIHRRDTKQLAKTLLNRYKTISAVCATPVEQLQRIKGLGRKSASLLTLVGNIQAVCLKERFERGSCITHWRDIETYLRMTFGYRSDEYVAALFLDGANRVIQTEVVAEGTVNQCALYPRRILEHALHYHAVSFIVAHNHPGGTPTPSESDWRITERLFTAGSSLDIALLDHILVCSDNVISLREMPRWPNR